MSNLALTLHHLPPKSKKLLSRRFKKYSFYWYIYNFHLSILKHSISRTNLNKNEELLTNSTAASNYTPKTMNLNQLKYHLSDQIYFVKLPLNVNIAKQDLLHRKPFLKMLCSEVWKGRISIDVDSGPLLCVLCCCGSICHQLFTFIQIGPGHTV